MTKHFKNFSKKLFKNKRGQGATEYILLLVVVVAVVMMFKGQIMGAVKEKMGQLSQGMGSITTEP